MQVRKCRTRIHKGIYAETNKYLIDGASRDRAAINAHFVRLFSNAIQAESFVGIATHDAQLIDALTNWLQRARIDRSRFEFQMLLGCANRYVTLCLRKGLSR
ncbi:hypothetical protein [Paraburkholderia fungorum]|jgi:proline dehydrogenase